MRSVAGCKLYLVAPAAFGTDRLAAAIDGGVDVVQLRMKAADAADVIASGEAWKEVCASRDVPFIVNDRPDIALALWANGVHLGQDDVPPAIAREVLGPHEIIGRSTHSESDIDRAVEEHHAGNCNYIAVGPVYHTPTHPTRAAVGLELVEYAAANVTFPWFAIGGIDSTNVAEVRGAGASAVCVVRAIVDAGDARTAARQLVEALA